MKSKTLYVLLGVCIIAAAVIYQVSFKPIAIVYDSVKLYRKDIKVLADSNNISFEDAVNLKINSIIESKEIDKNNISIEDEYIEELVSELEAHEPVMYSAIVEKITLEGYKQNLKEHHMRMELFNIITGDYAKTIDTSDKALKDWLNNNGVTAYTEEKFAELKAMIIEKMVAEKTKEYYNSWLADKRDLHSKRI